MASQNQNSFLVNTEASPFAALRPVSMQDVRLLDGFWSDKLQVNRTRTLQFQHQYLESTGRLDNIRRAARRLDQPFRGRVYDESDVYKWLEAAFWTLGLFPDPGLKTRVDAVVSDLRAAQRPDGYLNTYYVEEVSGDRWGNLKDQHELYCAGHLIQAGVAGRRAVGDDQLFAVAVRFADHICESFGPGKIDGTGGHPEIEMALVELFRETGEIRYLEQAKYFLDVRGTGKVGGLEYHQDHKPFRELDRLTGHAVRALYLCAGAADIYLETGGPELLNALERLWVQMTSHQMYITGGVGGRVQGEAFGKDYELPNMEAYAESCAAIANIMWNWRMLQISGNARYTDLIETILYNGFLAGIAGDGCGYFYSNPLGSVGDISRASWYGTACCPPNLARTLAGLPGLIYSRSAAVVWIHLFANNEVDLENVNGVDVSLKMETNYPWDGSVDVEVESAGEFALNLRIPEWAGDGVVLTVNGERSEQMPEPGTYFRLHRIWSGGDRVRLELPLRPRVMVSHPAVQANQGRIALRRGPLVYCLEAVDNPDIDPNGLTMNPDVEITSRFSSQVLGRVVVLAGEGTLAVDGVDWQTALYREATPAGAEARRQVRWIAVPYFAWANRSAGWMRVWVRASGNCNNLPPVK